MIIWGKESCDSTWFSLWYFALFHRWNGGRFDSWVFLVVTQKRNSWNHTMAVLDTAAELNSVLLDIWRREDQANLSPVSTLKGLVFISFSILVSIYYFSTFYKFDSIVSCTQSGFSNLLIWLAFCGSFNYYIFLVFIILSILWFSVKTEFW